MSSAGRDRVRRLVRPSVSRALLVVTAGVLLVLPIVQGYLGAFAVTAGLVLAAAFVDRPAWIRLVLAVLGSAFLMLAIVSIPSAEGLWDAVIPPAAAVMPTAAAWRLWSAFRSPRVLDARRQRRRRRARWMMLAGGTGCLIGAAILLSLGTHPSDPIFLSEQSTCGSIIRPRHFETQKVATEEEEFAQAVSSSFASTDCEFAREERLVWVLLLGQVAVLLIASAVWRRTAPAPSDPLGDDEAVLHPPVGTTEARPLLRHPLVTSTAVAAAIAAISIVLTLRVDNSVDLADELNAQAALWLKTYAPLQQELNEGAIEIAKARGRDDFPKIAAECERMRSLAAEMDQAPNDLPGLLHFLRGDFETFLEHVSRGATKCIAGARARPRDDELLQESASEFLQAAKAAARIQSALKPR